MSVSPRGWAKAVAEAALLPLARLASRRNARSGVAAVLAYHNVVPSGADPAGDASLHVPLDAFRAQLDRLQTTHRVVPLREVARQPPSERPAVAITFDDAYRGCLRLALPELAARGLPATVFVPPGLLGTEAFWWDGLASGRGGLDPAVRRRCLERDRGKPRHSGQAPGADHGPGDVDELRTAVALPDIEVAAHSWSHPDLCALDDGELRDELDRPRRWLVERFPERALPDHLSFPYGSWDRRVAGAARDAGYRYLYRVDGGVGRPEELDTGTWLVPRVNVPSGATIHGFQRRVSGLG